MTNGAPKKERIRLLVVSVGSLVGRNILDSLEFSGLPRRGLVRLIGTNSVADAPNNFRCDECFLVPPTASPHYAAAMSSVIRRARPDLILSARDADTSALWSLLEADPSLPGRLPYGNLRTILYALDKWQSFLFCEKYGLPFARSLRADAGCELETLRAFVEAVGYPLIAKPVEGFASKGVFFARNWAEVLHFRDQAGYLLQEYIGEPEALEPYFRMLEGPKPLFSEAPGVNHHTCHIPIDPEGRVGEIFVLRNHHNFGAVTRLRRVHHPELEALARRFAEAFVTEGGRGPLSVQFREDRHGGHKAQEMNLRTTGSTHARLMMGQDELGWLVRNWVPGAGDFPLFERSEPAFGLTVAKSLGSDMVWSSDVGALERKAHWRWPGLDAAATEPAPALQQTR